MGRTLVAFLLGLFLWIGTSQVKGEENDCAMERRVPVDYVHAPGQEHCRAYEDPLLRFIQLRCEHDGLVRNVTAKVSVVECTILPKPGLPEGRKELKYVAHETIGVPVGQSAIQVGDTDVKIIPVPGCEPGHLISASLTYPQSERRVQITVLLAN